MKNIIISFLSFLGLISCNGQSKKLSNEESKIIQIINLNNEIAEKIKQNSTGNFEVAKGFDDREMLYENIESLKNYSKNLPKAIKIKAKAENATQIVKNFKDELKSQNLIIYKSVENYGNEDDVVTIIKSENKFEPLYFEGTNAVNYDINTPQIVEKLKLWDSKYGVEIYGASFDLVSGEFKNQPNDIKKFASEMYEFCPDIVDQGVGSLDELINTLKESKQFFLWWD